MGIERSAAVDIWEASQLAHRYALALDDCDAAGFAKLFTQDVVFDNIGVGTRTRDQILGIPQVLKERFSWTFHSITTHHVVIDGDRGKGQTYCSASHHWRVNYNSGRPDPIGVIYKYLLRYDDVLMREEGAWRFAVRRVRLLGRQIEQMTSDIADRQAFEAELLPFVAG